MHPDPSGSTSLGWVLVKIVVGLGATLVNFFQGILSFISSPLVGALSDVCGRKPFLLLTVFFTCMPIPCLKISPWYFFINFY